MHVTFKNKKTKKTCESHKELMKSFGQSRAKKIQNRLISLSCAQCLEDIPHTPPWRRHQLTGNKDEEFTIDIEDQWRILLKPNNDEIPRTEDGGIDLRKVTSVLIINICKDTH